VLEALIAVAILLFFLGVAFLSSFLSWEALITIGASLTALGLVIGLPGGLLYHVKLRKELLTLGALPPRWWLHPTNHHGSLKPEQRRRVQSAFFVGGLGFGVTILGALVTFLSALK
jgi:hypothetical protein